MNYILYTLIITSNTKYSHTRRIHNTLVAQLSIYMLKCPCGKAYVGKTKRQMKMHIEKHKRSIDNCDLDRMKYVFLVSIHFKNHGHNSSLLRWLVLQIVKFLWQGGNLDRLLLQQEFFWILRLNTGPNGTK
ncbi:hypothetical protein XELAEV_18014508mg [Xenopus laevis]|uniref:GIY-YIG domain-containing protein n=1 Tax=Xenopus laevis TaxID=8355 RepID=A0A974DGF0_XENLA|nr:hypothetical protein XELAEV_18014508mg [Xenopus laevis]